jgi:hypothetical protein
MAFEHPGRSSYDLRQLALEWQLLQDARNWSWANPVRERKDHRARLGRNPFRDPVTASPASPEVEMAEAAPPAGSITEEEVASAVVRLSLALEQTT